MMKETKECWICGEEADFKDQMGDLICGNCVDRIENKLHKKFSNDVLPLVKLIKEDYELITLDSRCLCCTDSCKHEEEFYINGIELQNVNGNWAIEIKDLVRRLKKGGHI